MHVITKEPSYYLPLGYNDNKIILLVRDPYCLFAYWEISNEKRNNFVKQFGENSWNNSRSVIKLVNITRNKVEYVEVNDYASNWYINVNEPNCIFHAELGRMFSDNFFISLVTSNSVHTPSDTMSNTESILFANYKDLRIVKKTIIRPDLGKYEYSLSDIDFGLSSAIISGISSESFIK